ncbi:MAG TPA: flippase [Actinomycetota bacterium]|nr:flippase [Actinomycetota bacterium]
MTFPQPDIVPRGLGLRRIAGNSAWQVVSFTFRGLAGLGVVVALARVEGPGRLGVFQFALTLTSLLPYYWGYPALLSREVARRPGHVRGWLEGGMAMTFVFGIAFSIALTVGARTFGASPESQMTITLATTAMIFDGIARIQFAAFVAWERMRLETIATALQETMFLVGAVIAVGLGGGPVGAMIAFLASRFVGALIAWITASLRCRTLLLPAWHGGFAVRSAVSATPFAAADTLKLVQMRGDAVLLGLMKGPAAVGLYQACTSLVMHWNVLARSLNHAVYPRMSRAWPAHPTRFARYRDASNRSLAMIGLPVAIGGALLAADILHALYGPKFARATLAFQILVLVVPIRMMSNTLSLSLAACDRQRQRTKAIALAASANLTLNLALIPIWSYLGSAAATLATETGLLVGYALQLRPAIGSSRMMQAIALPATACVPLAAAVMATRSAPLVVPMLAGALAYGGTLTLAAMIRFRHESRSPVAALIGLVRPT